MSAVLAPAPEVRDALLAAAALAQAQPGTSRALASAMGFLSLYPHAREAWATAVSPSGLSPALVLGRSTPEGVAASLRRVAGGAL